MVRRRTSVPVVISGLWPISGSDNSGVSTCRSLSSRFSSSVLFSISDEDLTTSVFSVTTVTVASGISSVSSSTAPSPILEVSGLKELEIHSGNVYTPCHGVFLVSGNDHAVDRHLETKMTNLLWNGIVKQVL